MIDSCAGVAWPISGSRVYRTLLSRSPLAHARITAVHVPERHRDVVFTAADLSGVKPIRAVSGLLGFKISEQPVLATGKVRHVGELVAMCVAATRADAEDIAASVRLDLEELPAKQTQEGHTEASADGVLIRPRRPDNDSGGLGLSRSSAFATRSMKAMRRASVAMLR
jgi:CO/xanthine dehydrogenase Mo-binding subunit